MPTGILIPVDESEEITVIEVNDFEDYRRVIGGYFQVIDLENPEASLYMDEEGKIKQQPVNRRATLLLWAHRSVFRSRDVVCGPSILIGAPDGFGETQDVPDQLLSLLTATSKFKYQVKTINDNEWAGNALTFSDWVEAYNAALGLADRWTLVTEVQVVPA
jgi:hypothetical protein